MRARAERLGLDGVHQRQNQQVEHAAAEHIAKRDVRERCEGGRPKTGE
jgi:hypothetical protein